MSATAVILDTETTTNKDTPERKLEVIELAYQEMREGAVPYVYRFKPQRPAAWGALAVHHILPEELVDCPPSDTAPACAPQVDYWIGHNIDFDWKALGSPAGVRRICTLALARSLWPELDSHTLSACYYFVKGAKPETRAALRSAHSAEADLGFCLEILQPMMQLLKTRDLDALWEYSEEARIPKKMSFGKFAGEPISSVDRGYAAWYNRQVDPDPYVIKAFRRAGLLK